MKGKMRADRRLQNLVPKARTKKELAQRKADEEKLAVKSEKCAMTMGMNGGSMMHSGMTK